MAHQSLDHNEILNVRWATVDPNPMAQAREARKIEEQAAEAVRRALPAEFVAEIEGKDPEARKRKRIEGSFGLEGYQAPDEIWYARANQKRLNPSEEMMMLEGFESGRQGDEASYSAVPAAAVRDERQRQPEASNGAGGILSSSTLAALKGYSVQIGSSGGGGGGGGGTGDPDARNQHHPTIGGGSGGALSSNALVSYGSSDDEDD